MADVGEISITGSIDESAIVGGLDRITDQLKEMENQFNQVNQPMARTAKFASKLGKSLIAIGTTGVAAMVALATKSPVLATVFAKMEVSTLKLSNTIGRLLKPAFEGANTLLMNLNEALLDHSSTVSTVARAVGTTFEDMGNIITGQWSAIEGIIPKGAGVALGIKLGMPFGLPGMMLGAALGAIAGSIVEEKVKGDLPTGAEDVYKAAYGTFAESFLIADVGIYKTQQFLDKYSKYDPRGAIGGAGILAGYAGYAGAQLMVDALQWLATVGSDKDRAFSNANGVHPSGD